MLNGASGGHRAPVLAPPLVAWSVFRPRLIQSPPRLFRKTIGAILFENFGMGYFQIIGEMPVSVDSPRPVYADFHYAPLEDVA